MPNWVKQGDIPLRIESYEAFQTIARTTIDKMKMKRSTDPSAGRPIIGTAAARMLDPVRNRQAVQAAKADRTTTKPKQDEAKPAARKQAGKARSKASGRKVTSDPPAAAGGST